MNKLKKICQDGEEQENSGRKLKPRRRSSLSVSSKDGATFQLRFLELPHLTGRGIFSTQSPELVGKKNSIINRKKFTFLEKVKRVEKGKMEK